MMSTNALLSALIAVLLVVRTVHCDLNTEEDFLVEYTQGVLLGQSLVLNNTASVNWGTDCQRKKPKGSVFNCPVSKGSFVKAQNVNELKPYDIEVVAAMGDSLTAAFGARACNIFQLFKDYRGISWSIGGDYGPGVSTSTTLPNILRLYSPNLRGFSIKSGNEKSKNAHFNVAVTGAIAQDVFGQAKNLVKKMRSAMTLQEFRTKWKMVTVLIGGNNLCKYCEDKVKNSPATYVQSVKRALDYLKNNLPRAFVNLNQALDITAIKAYKGLFCEAVHLLACPCKRDTETHKIVKRYQKGLEDLINTGVYDNNPQFTVVLQPFLTHIELPKDDEKYLALDCFHFSTEGHKEAAKALWNNMIEPVGMKTKAWRPGGTLLCPFQSYPYFFTRKNSRTFIANHFASEEGGAKDRVHRRPSYRFKD